VLFRERYSLKPLSALILEKPDGPIYQTELFPRLGPCSTSLQPPLSLSPCYASLRLHWLKFQSSALPDPDCPPISEHPPIPTLIACVAALELLLSLGEPDGPVYHSELSSFST
jgi:hypothetical protein